jgi:hypothetical protein
MPWRGKSLPDIPVSHKVGHILYKMHIAVREEQNVISNLQQRLIIMI